MKIVAAITAVLLLLGVAGCTRSYKQDNRDHGNPLAKDKAGKAAVRSPAPAKQ
jgi:uncharacterized protein YxeA